MLIVAAEYNNQFFNQQIHPAHPLGEEMLSGLTRPCHMLFI
jgi:hypothetical protein